jgi:hypothetical protein
MAELSEQFAAVTDQRSEGRIRYSMSDTLKSTFAMFSLKSSSLLNVQERTRIEDGNVRRVYGIGDIPSDTQMWAILDEVPPKALQYSFAEMFDYLKSRDALASYRSEAANGALTASV